MTPQDIPALYLKHGSLKAIARAVGRSYHYVQIRYNAAVSDGLMEPLALGRKTQAALKAPTVKIKQRTKALKTKKHRHHTYILTCAQNNTAIHMPTWLNLLALAKDREAKIFVSTFLYAARSHWQKNLDKGRAAKNDAGHDDLLVRPARRSLHQQRSRRDRQGPRLVRRTEHQPDRGGAPIRP